MRAKHMLFTEVEELHDERDGEICKCGESLDVPKWMLSEFGPEVSRDEMHLSHKTKAKKDWLDSNGYGPIHHTWATCGYCGCLVALLDLHREVCP